MEQESPKTIPLKKPMSEEPVEPEISQTTWILMIGTALFFDACKLLLQFLPIVGQIISIAVGWFAFATFWLWFKMRGTTYSRKTMLIGFITDFIPVLDVLSETGTILALYLQSKSKKALAKVPGGEKITDKAFKKAA